MSQFTFPHELTNRNILPLSEEDKLHKEPLNSLKLC